MRIRAGTLEPSEFVQRLGGAFIEDADDPGGPLAFRTLSPPTNAEIAALGLRLATRIGNLARHPRPRRPDLADSRHCMLHTVLAGIQRRA